MGLVVQQAWEENSGYELISTNGHKFILIKGIHDARFLKVLIRTLYRSSFD